MRPLIRTRFSDAPRCTRPAGTSVFSRFTAATTMSGDTPSASIRSGSSSTCTSRRTPPATVTLPTPVMFCNRRLMLSSASSVRSRRGWPVPRSENVMIGSAPGSKRAMTGGSMSCGRSWRMASILERTSAMASMTLVCNRNSTSTCEKPSFEYEMTFFTPSTEFTASSIFLVTSRSTASGEAPG